MVERVTSCGSEQITSLGSSVGLAAIPVNAGWAIIKPRGAPINLRFFGGYGTNRDMQIPTDTPVEVTSKLADVRMIGAGATVDVWYFG